MSKQSKRPSRASREQRSSSLGDHRRDRKVLRPPLRTLPNLQSVGWARDYWPDMIWVCTTIFHHRQVQGLHLCADVLDVIDDVVQPHFSKLEERDRPILDGRLTSFELVPKELRSEVIRKLRQAELFERGFPEEFAHVMGLYPEAPGRWLVEPWLDGWGGVSINWERALAYLAPVRIESEFHQSQLATDAKFIVLRQFVKGQKLFLPNPVPHGFALLHRYPDGLTEDELRTARPTIRATWNMLGPSADENRTVTGPSWARMFWRANWNLFPCAASEIENGNADGEGHVADIFSEHTARVDLLGQQLLLVARVADPDLYSPSRYEVLTGVAMRALRMVNITMSNPVLGTEDFVMQSIRIVVEALIVLRWLIRKDNSKLYDQFKDYGRGRLKLLKLHSEEYLESLGEAAPEELVDYVEQLRLEVNRDIYEEFQDIDVGGTFSGVSARDMADQVGMEKEYRLFFAPGSAATHGEWPVLNRYALSPCANPLHGGHMLPRVSEWLAVDVRNVSSLVGFLGEVVETYKGAMTETKVKHL